MVEARDRGDIYGVNLDPEDSPGNVLDDGEQSLTWGSVGHSLTLNHKGPEYL